MFRLLDDAGDQWLCYAGQGDPCIGFGQRPAGRGVVLVSEVPASLGSPTGVTNGVTNGVTDGVTDGVTNCLQDVAVCCNAAVFGMVQAVRNEVLALDSNGQHWTYSMDCPLSSCSIVTLHGWRCHLVSSIILLADWPQVD
jgi:hypothetical protein